MSELEQWAAEVHGVYLETATTLKWPIRPEVAVPYADLSEAAKELDRAFARWALAKQASSLEWILLDDLLTELRRRFTCVVFAGSQELNQRTTQEYIRFKGNFRQAQGLAIAILVGIQQAVEGQTHQERVADET